MFPLVNGITILWCLQEEMVKARLEATTVAKDLTQVIHVALNNFFIVVAAAQSFCVAYSFILLVISDALCRS